MNKPLNKVVVGVTGLELCGKTAFCIALRAKLEQQTLKQRPLRVETISTELLLDQGLRLFALTPGYHSRDALRTALERAFGERLIIGAMHARIEAAAADVLIWDGVRTQINLQELCQRYRTILCVVEASMEQRIAWLSALVPGTQAMQARRHFESRDNARPLARVILRRTPHLQVQAGVPDAFDSVVDQCVSQVLGRLHANH